MSFRGEVEVQAVAVPQPDSAAVITRENMLNAKQSAPCREGASNWDVPLIERKTMIGFGSCEVFQAASHSFQTIMDERFGM